MAIAAAMRGFCKTAAMSAASYVGDSPLFALDYLLRFMRVAVLLSVWRAILGEHGSAAGMSAASVLAYTLISEVFAEQLACRTELDQALWDGSIAMRFLRPAGMVAQFAADMAGRWSFGFAAFSIPLLLAAPLLGVDPRPAGFGWACLFAVSLSLGICVGLALEFVFGALLVAMEQNIYAFAQIRHAITVLLSGSLLPLAVLPWGLGDLFGWLPFASTASAPLRIYTGTGDPVPLLALQAAWAILLWALASRMWRVNREKLVSFGG